jgi:hypothetical protein
MTVVLAALALSAGVVGCSDKADDAASDRVSTTTTGPASREPSRSSSTTAPSSESSTSELPADERPADAAAFCDGVDRLRDDIRRLGGNSDANQNANSFSDRIDVIRKDLRDLRASAPDAARTELDELDRQLGQLRDALEKSNGSIGDALGKLAGQVVDTVQAGEAVVRRFVTVCR